MTPERTGSGRELRIVTWNLHHGVGMDRRLDLERIARVLRGIDADVIALQEVDARWGRRSGDEDQAARLAELLGMDHLMVPARTRGRRDASAGSFGNALLSRLPVLGSRVDPLPPWDAPGGWPEPRALGRVRVPLGGSVGDWPPAGQRDGSSVTIAVTHLDPADASLRRRAAATIVDLTADEQGPVVLLGDLNTSAAARELEPLRAAGFAVASEGHRTFPAPWPVRRLDGALVRGAVEPVGAHVPRVRVASDHRPLVLRVRAAT